MIDSTVFQVSLTGSSNQKMTQLQQHLLTTKSKYQQRKLTWTKAENPLFENKTERLRALIALSLGCDVFEGIMQCGVKAVVNTLEKIEKRLKVAQVA